MKKNGEEEGREVELEKEEEEIKELYRARNCACLQFVFLLFRLKRGISKPSACGITKPSACGISCALTAF